MNTREQTAELLASAIAQRVKIFGDRWNVKNGPLDISIIADACIMVLENVWAASPSTIDQTLQAVKIVKVKRAMIEGNQDELLRKLQ